MSGYVEALRKYATFVGRASRREYWMFVLFSLLLSVVIQFIDLSVGTYNFETGIGIFGTVYSIGILLPSLAVGVRRMHDVGKSGWFLLIPIYSLILTLSKGHEGTNEYGPDPREIKA